MKTLFVSGFVILLAISAWATLNNDSDMTQSQNMGNEGINVHGDWEVKIIDPDGSSEVFAFKNAVTNRGKLLLFHLFMPNDAIITSSQPYSAYPALEPKIRVENFGIIPHLSTDPGEIDYFGNWVGIYDYGTPDKKTNGCVDSIIWNDVNNVVIPTTVYTILNDINEDQYESGSPYFHLTGTCVVDFGQFEEEGFLTGVSTKIKLADGQFLDGNDNVHFTSKKLDDIPVQNDQIIQLSVKISFD
tara:strand:- start:148 stop:879 length:732 start_codon:yes stop_codon:yes gene_type:complete